MALLFLQHKLSENCGAELVSGALLASVLFCFSFFIEIFYGVSFSWTCDKCLVSLYFSEHSATFLTY